MGSTFDHGEDVCLGRFPVGNPWELKNMVDKMAAYSVTPGDRSWKNDIFNMAGIQDPDPLLQRQSLMLLAQRAHTSGYNVNYVHDSYTGQEPYSDYNYQMTRSGWEVLPQDTAHINSLLRQGSWLFNYRGHGEYNRSFAYNVYSPRTLFTGTSPMVTNPNKLHFVIEFSCHNANIDKLTTEFVPVLSFFDGCSELTLIKSQNGAIGFIGASRPMWASGGRHLFDITSQEIFTRNNHIAGMMYFRYKTAAISPQEIVCMHYMGDPALDLFSNPLTSNIIAEETIWNGYVVISQNTTVLPGVTLTLSPGAEIILMNGAELDIQGKLIAVGTPTQHIKIHGQVGQANGRVKFTDSNGATPWNRIKHCDFYNLEHCIYNENSVVSVENSTFSASNYGIFHNSALSNSNISVDRGIYCTGALSVDNTVFSSCQYGIIVNAGSINSYQNSFNSSSSIGVVVINQGTFIDTLSSYEHNIKGAFWGIGTPQIYFHQSTFNQNGENVPWHWGSKLTNATARFTCCSFTNNVGPAIAQLGGMINFDGEILNEVPEGAIYRGAVKTISGNANDTESWTGQIFLSENLGLTMAMGLNSIQNQNDQLYIGWSWNNSVSWFGHFENNYWGTNSVYYVSQRIPLGPSIEPLLETPAICSETIVADVVLDSAYREFSFARYEENTAQWVLAVNRYKHVVEEWPNSPYSKMAIDRIIFLEKIGLQNWTDIRTYFLEVADSTISEEMWYLAKGAAAWCLVEQALFTQAESEYVALLNSSSPYFSELKYSITELMIQLQQTNWEGKRSLSSLEQAQMSALRTDNFLNQLDYVLSGIKPSPEQQNASPLPDKFALHPIYPNPFNPTTNIRIDIPKNTNVKVLVFDYLGRLVTTVAKKEVVAGRYTFQWNGNSVASGVYFVMVKTPEFNSTRKMVLLK